MLNNKILKINYQYLIIIKRLRRKTLLSILLIIIHGVKWLMLVWSHLKMGCGKGGTKGGNLFIELLSSYKEAFAGYIYTVINKYYVTH